MVFHKQCLDLVPGGLIIMFGYHLFLLYRYLKLPHKTVLGFENNDKRAWIVKFMKSDEKDVRLALDVISSNTSAATFLASVSLTLSSLIGAWIANNANVFESAIIYGDTRPETMSIKFVSLLICFLLAFFCFVQSSRCFIHASFLISMPDSDLPPKYVEMAVIRGGDFWSLGLRAIYIATVLLLWFFGPVLMFACSISMVVFLHYLDSNSVPLIQHRCPAKSPVKSAGAEIATCLDVE